MFVEVRVFLCADTLFESTEPLTMPEEGGFVAESIITVLGLKISEHGKISQFDAHWPKTPCMEFDPNSSGGRPTKLLLFRSWRIGPMGCLNDPESTSGAPAD